MYTAVRAIASSYAQPQGPGGVFGAFGQLGGSWGWYALLLQNPLVTRFSAWIWTDAGTAKLVVDTMKGRQGAGKAYEVVTAGRSDYQWQELKLDGQHLSWIYTDAAGVVAVRQALSPTGLASCTVTKQCYAALGPGGAMVS